MSDVRQRLYLFQLADVVGPFLALYGLWFTTTTTVREASVVFGVWAVVALLAEVPTGVLADSWPRRRVLAIGLVLRALALVVFVLWPSLPGFVVGACLWAVHLAMHSGAWEALVYSAVADDDDEATYLQVMARLGQIEQTGAVLALGAGSLWLAAGASLTALAWLTVLWQAGVLALLWRIPERDRSVPQDEAVGSILDGVRRALAQTPILALLVTAAVLESTSEIDEFIPALGVARGSPEAWVPLLMIAVWAGMLLGGEAAARWGSRSRRGLGVALGVGGGVGIAGLLSGSVWGILALAAVFAAYNLAWFVLDADLQDRLEDDSRASVSSVRAFVANVGSVLAFGVVGVLSIGGDPTRGMLAVLAVPMIIGAVVVSGRMLPTRAD